MGNAIGSSQISRSNEESTKEVKASVSFPPEVMMEILSWLPVKSLARAQLVCREWRVQIQDHRFLDLHINRTSHTSYWYNRLNTTDDQDIATAAVDGSFSLFSIFHGCNGLILMRNNTSQKDVVWNPAARLVLELPPYAHPDTGNYGPVLSFVPSTQNYKVVSFFKDSSRRGCHAVTLGGSMEWRQLAFPEKNANSKLRGFVVPTAGAIHYCACAVGAVEIVSLDVETELFTLNRLPVYSQTAKAIDCDGKLGFAAVVGQDLEVTVLEDYRKNKWCRDKQVIPLPFLKKKCFEGNVVILFIKQGEIWLFSQNENVYAYKIETGKIRFVATCKGISYSGKLQHVYKPSFVTFEGMLRVDADLEALVQRLKLLLD